jgi:hypothetical protein
MAMMMMCVKSVRRWRGQGSRQSGGLKAIHKAEEEEKEEEEEQEEEEDAHHDVHSCE